MVATLPIASPEEMLKAVYERVKNFANSPAGFVICVLAVLKRQSVDILLTDSGWEAILLAIDFCEENGWNHDLHELCSESIPLSHIKGNERKLALERASILASRDKNYRSAAYYCKDVGNEVKAREYLLIGVGYYLGIGFYDFAVYCANDLGLKEQARSVRLAEMKHYEKKEEFYTAGVVAGMVGMDEKKSELLHKAVKIAFEEKEMGAPNSKIYEGTKAADELGLEKEAGEIRARFDKWLKEEQEKRPIYSVNKIW